MVNDINLPKLKDKYICVNRECYTIKIMVNDLDTYLKSLPLSLTKEIIIPSVSKYNLTSDKILNLDLALLFLSSSINKLNAYLGKPIAYPVKIDDLVLINLENAKLHYNSKTFNSIYPNLPDNMLIFIPIGIARTFSSNLHHLTILVIDKQSSTFTYYEPYGYYDITPNSSERDIYNNGFDKLIEMIHTSFPNFKYIDAHEGDSDKEIGVQRRSESVYYNIPNSGYCVAWCTYICYLRLFNYHLSSRYPITVLLNKVFVFYTNEQLLDMIRRFVEYIKHQFNGFKDDIFDLRDFYSIYDQSVDISKGIDVIMNETETETETKMDIEDFMEWMKDENET